MCFIYLKKASGPDDIHNNWFLKNFAEILAQPICEILTAVMLKGGATGGCGGGGGTTPPHTRQQIGKSLPQSAKLID
jgi:hypothetical protein